jgi:hypothetical protein
VLRRAAKVQTRSWLIFASCGLALFVLGFLWFFPLTWYQFRIRSADRVVISAVFIKTEVTLTGDKARRFTQALCSGYHAEEHRSNDPKHLYYRVAFYSGDNHLGTLNAGRYWFFVKGQPYADRLGVIDPAAFPIREANRRRWNEEKRDFPN